MFSVQNDLLQEIIKDLGSVLLKAPYLEHFFFSQVFLNSIQMLETFSLWERESENLIASLKRFQSDIHNFEILGIIEGSWDFFNCFIWKSSFVVLEKSGETGTTEEISCMKTSPHKMCRKEEKHQHCPLLVSETVFKYSDTHYHC